MTFTGSGHRGCKLLVAGAFAWGMLTSAALAHTPEEEQNRITACMIRQRALLSEGCKAVFQKETPAAVTPVKYSPAKPAKPINLVPARVK
jgi:hypothetical protein